MVLCIWKWLAVRVDRAEDWDWWAVGKVVHRWRWRVWRVWGAGVADRAEGAREVGEGAKHCDGAWGWRWLLGYGWHAWRELS